MAAKTKKPEIDLGIGSAMAEIGDCDDSLPGIDLFEAGSINTASTELMPVSDTPNQLIELANELDYEGELSVGALEDGIRLYQRRTVEDLLMLGKYLLLLKQACKHGEFLPRIELLGVSKRTAQRFMQAVHKISKSDTAALLTTKVKDQGRLLELLTLDDDEIKGLVDGEDIAGVELDEVDSMSVSELRRAIRAHKQESEEHAKRIQTALTESLADKHAKEKAGLEGEIRDKAADAKKAEERANRLQCQLDEKEDLIDTLRNAQNLNPEFRLETNIIREQSALLDQQCAVALAALGDMADALDNEDGSEPEWPIRFQSVWFAAHAAHARALLLVQRLRSMDVDDLLIPADPGEFQAGLFTAQEAKVFIDEVDSNRIVLAEKLKQKRDKLEEDAPRGPGRPKKVKNQK